MPYFKKSEYRFIKFEKSTRKNKMYNALLRSKVDNKIVKVHFGDSNYENYRDKTGLNLYPKLIHNDKDRRKLYRLRHGKDIKDGYYSPGFFSWYYLW